MPNIELLFIIVALISFIIGVVAGIFLGARLTRSHYLFMVRMMQPQRQAPPPQQQQRPRRPTRQLYRDEEPYY